MWIKFVLISLILIYPSSGHAQMTLRDWAVGGAIKNLAKIYVKTSNLAKLKDKYIKMILKMREDKFHKHYSKFYTVYKQLPSDLKKDYVFDETPTKKQVIDRINHVDKRDLITIINRIPSEFIVQQTRHYSHPPQNQLPAQGASVNEMFLWRRIIQKV